MRMTFIAPLLCLPGLACAAAAVSELQPSPRCELLEPTFDSREVACSLAPRPGAHRYTLQVNFSGGHDDTMAKIAGTTFDGAPLICEDGSKTSLMGEDGDVSLLCVFTAPGRSERTSFVGRFTWSHAQYVGYSLSKQ